MSLLAALLVLADAAPMTVRCGAVERPGIAQRGLDGVWRGSAVYICAAAAREAFGPTARTEFHGYKTDFADARNDRIAFLTDLELSQPALTGSMRAGPVVGHELQVLLVPRSSSIRHREDLAARLVCFMIGSAAEDALDSWASRERVAIERLGFQEPDEMHDAYASAKCAAMAVDPADQAGNIATFPFDSRVLDPPLASSAVMAATPIAADTAWEQAVARAAAASPETARGIRLSRP